MNFRRSIQLPARVLIQTVLIFTVLFDGLGSFGVEVPFSDRNIISSFDSGEYQSQSRPPEYGSVFVQAADLDGDADLDVVEESRVHERIDSGTVAFQIRNLSGGTKNIQVVDMDGDLNPDILSKSVWYKVSGVAPLTFTAQPLNFDGGDLQGAFDFDEDGDQDLLTFSNNRNDATMEWHENTGGDPPVYQARLIDATANETRVIDFLLAEVGDLDRDGDLDLMVISQYGSSRRFYLYENDGNAPAQFVKHSAPDPQGNFQDISMADLDSDGDNDFFVKRAEYEWFEAGGAHFSDFKTRNLSLEYATTKEQWALAAGDLDGDSWMDVIATRSYVVSWFENDRGTIPEFSERILDYPPSHTGLNFGGIFPSYSVPSARDLFVIDFDKDGDMDLLERYSAREYRENGLGPDTYRDFREAVWYENQAGIYTTQASFQETDKGGGGAADGVFEPGETGALAVDIASLTGRDLTGVSLIVSTTAEGLIFPEPILDLGKVVAGETRTVSVRFEIAESIVCGSSLTASVEIDWGTGSTVVSAIPVSVGTKITFNSFADTAPGLPIPDNDPNGAASSLHIGAPGAGIVFLGVGVDISHTYRGDLLILLETPGGPTLTVFEGDPNDGTLDVVGAVEIGGVSGLPADGTYTLAVFDRALHDTGTLNSWFLTVDHREYVCGNDAEAMTADFYRDSILNGWDLFRFQKHWKQAPSPREIDLDQDGNIDFDDLLGVTTALKGTSP